MNKCKQIIIFVADELLRLIKGPDNNNNTPEAG